MAFLDKTYCASPDCKNDCGRKMTDDEKEYLKELTFRGLKASALISYAYFCGEHDNRGADGDALFADKR
jgi:hypothetical protein